MDYQEQSCNHNTMGNTEPWSTCAQGEAETNLEKLYVQLVKETLINSLQHHS